MTNLSNISPDPGFCTKIKPTAFFMLSKKKMQLNNTRAPLHENGQSIVLITLQILFWQESTATSTAARAVAPIISTLEDPCRQLASTNTSLNAVEGHLDSIYTTLLALWEAQADSRFVYPEIRMAHLLRMIGASLRTLCVASLRQGSASPWQRSGPQLRVDAHEVLTLLHWTHGRVRQLMLDWCPGPAAISRHAWSGPPFVDQDCAALARRVEEACAVVELEGEMAAALGADRVAAVTEAFSAVHSVDFTDVCLRSVE
jgi:hypothetical protein